MTKKKKKKRLSINKKIIISLGILLLLMISGAIYYRFFLRSRFLCDYKGIGTKDSTNGYPVKMENTFLLKDIYDIVKTKDDYHFTYYFSDDKKYMRYLRISKKFNEGVYNVVFETDTDENVNVVNFDSYDFGMLMPKKTRIPCDLSDNVIKLSANKFITDMQLPSNIEKELLSKYQVYNFVDIYTSR